MVQNEVKSIVSPCVSVVMPLHAGANRDAMILAIESILTQTFQDLELILSVDGPIPDTLHSIITTLSQNDPRIRIVHIPVNSGPAIARNTAYAICQGTYIANLDSDDIAFPQRLELQIAALETHNTDVVGSAYIEFKENIHDSSMRSLPLLSEDIKRYLLWGNPIATSTILAKSDILKQFLYRENFRVCEDYDLCIRMIKGGVRIINLPEPTVYYRCGNDFGNRRGGFLWGKFDFLNKINIISLFPFYFSPFIVCLAVASFCIRLLPSSLLEKIRAIRFSIFSHKASRRKS